VDWLALLYLHVDQMRASQAPQRKNSESFTNHDKSPPFVEYAHLFFRGSRMHYSSQTGASSYLPYGMISNYDIPKATGVAPFTLSGSQSPGTEYSRYTNGVMAQTRLDMQYTKP
jgi:hypothetical protein